MTAIHCTFLILVLICPVLTHAQEVKYAELSFAQQRTELRHPPAPPSECKDGMCIGGGGVSVSVEDSAPDQRDPHALAVYLVRVEPTEIDTSKPFQAEFKILNSGRASIEVPVYSHLSDLQPSDESVPFSYFSIALVVQGECAPEGTCSNVPAQGYIQLYGSREHGGTLLELRPGEWIRARATMKLHTWPLEPISGHLRGGFWLRKNTFRPQPGGGSIETQNLYPNTVVTPSIAVRFHPPKTSEH